MNNVTRQPVSKMKVIALLTSGAVLSLGQSAQASPDTWSASATSTSWALGTNWSLANPPGTGDVATFDSTTYANQPILDANTPQSVLGLQFGDGTTAAGVLTIGATATQGANNKPSGTVTTGATTIPLVSSSTAVVGDLVTGTGIATGTVITGISGNTITISQATTAGLTTATQLTVTPTLTIGTGGITVSAGVAGIQTISAPIIVGGTETWADNATLSGALTVSGNIILGSNVLTISGAASSSSTISGVVTGTGSLTINSLGTVDLAGANTFSGGVTLSGGTLYLGSATALGTGTLAIGAGTNITSGGGGITTTTNNAQTWNGSYTIGVSGHTINLGNGAITVATPLTVTVSAGTVVDGGTISGGNGIFDVTKAGGGTLSLGTNVTFAGTKTLNVTAGVETFTGTFAGTNTPVIDINGAGFVSFSGSAGTATSSSVVVTGTTSLMGLNFDSSAGITSSARAASVTLTRGEVTVTGNATNNSVDAITGALTIDGSGGYTDWVAITPNSAKNAELTAGSLAQTNGGVVVFSGTNLGANSIASATVNSSNISFGTGPTLVGGGGGAGSTDISIIPFALGASTIGGAGNTFVTYTTANGIRPLNTSTEFDTSISSGTTNTDNVELSSATANASLGTISSATTINSLILNASASSGTSTLDGSGVLTVTSGAVLIDPADAKNGVTINSGLNFGSAMGYIGASFNYAASINGPITGTGGVTFYQTGNSTITNNINLNGANTYSGSTYIIGHVALGSGSALPSGSGTGDIYLTGQLTLPTFLATTTINGLNGTGIVIYGNTTAGPILSVGANNDNANFSGQIVQTSNTLNLVKVGTGTQTLSGTTSNYKGTTSIQNGALSVTTLNSVTGGVSSSSLGTPSSVANGTIALGSTSTGGTLVDIGTGETTDRVINLAGTTGGGTLDQSGTGNLDFTSSFTATGAGSKALTLQGSTAGTGEIDGALVDNSSTNKTSLVKAGTGAWTLQGANTYSGGTTVNAGTLYVNNASGSGTGSGAVLVTAGKLAGKGTIQGAVTVQTGATLSSGAAQTNVISATNPTGVDTITGAGLTLNSSLGVNAGSSLTFALGAGGSSNPLGYGSPNMNSTYLNVTGSTAGEVTFGTGTAITIKLVDLTAFSPTDTLQLRTSSPYLLIAAGSDSDYANLVTTGGLDQNGYVLGVGTSALGTVTPFTIGVYDINGKEIDTATNYEGLQLYLNNGDLEVVPEPGTWALMIGGLALLVVIQRRRNRQG